MKNILVTTPLFYINSEVHIGHEYSIFIASYICSVLDAFGFRPVLMTGTDENGNKADLNRKDQLRVYLQDIVSKIHQKPFIFYSTGSVYHYSFIQNIYKKFIPYIEEGFYGNSVSLQFNMSKVWTCTNLLTEFYKKETDEICNNFEKIIHISRENSIGIKINDKYGFIWVWFDALLSYINVGQNYDHVIHVIGKDILRFHTYYLGSMEKILKQKRSYLYVHGWILNNGVKISKSLDNRFETSLDSDCKKYMLMSIAGPKDWSINSSEVEFYRKVFYKRYINLISRCLGILDPNISIKITKQKIPLTLNIQKSVKIFNTTCEYCLYYLQENPLSTLTDFLNLIYRYKDIFSCIGYELVRILDVDSNLKVKDLITIKTYVTEILRYGI